MSQHTQHTPGPWKLDGGKGTKGQRYIWTHRKEEDAGGYIGTHEVCIAAALPGLKSTRVLYDSEIKANAAFIVTACNAHDKLSAFVALVADMTQSHEINAPDVDDSTETLDRLIFEARELLK